MRTVDVVVVGGGVAGLVGACETARGGLSTLLLEAAPDVGGRARTRDSGGYALNQGPHALYVEGAFRKALADLGVDHPGRPPNIAAGALLWGEARHPLPLSLGAILRLTPLGVLDRLQLARTFGQIAEGRYGLRGQPLRAFTSALRPKVGQLLEAMVRLSTYANAPDDIDGQAALDQVRLSLGGVIYLDGGWGRIVEGLRRVGETAGVEVATSRRAALVVRSGENWRTRVEGGEVVESRSVILAVDPAESPRLCPSSVELSRAVALARPIRAVSLDLALSSRPVAGSGFALGVDEALYFSIHSDAAKLAPEGGAVIHASRYLAPDEAARPEHLERLERLVTLMQPGWRAAEVGRQRLTGIVVTHDIPHHARGGRRAPVSPADAPGLFLAGDWVGDAGMLSDASAASARAAAAGVLQRQGRGIMKAA